MLFLNPTKQIRPVAIQKDIPFVPSADERIDTMLELAGNVKDKRVIDLGSGDGKVMIAFARKGAKTFGVEIDPSIFRRSLENIQKARLAGKIIVVNQDFWDVDLQYFDIVTLFGVTSLMPKLEPKLQKELRSGSKVISNFFEFPTWTSSRKKKDVYLYIK